MARSLTVRHEEKATLNPLFTGFLLLAVTWLALSAAGYGPEAAEASPGSAAASSYEP
jgi:hypothetical protein